MMKHILLVEDDPQILEALDLMLRFEGYAVTVCKSGNEAVKILSHVSFDLVVSDYNMPDGNGSVALEFLTIIKSSIPFIFFTAYLNLGKGNTDRYFIVHKPNTLELLQRINSIFTV